MARLLALDLGTACGWALSDNANVTYGTWDLKPGKFGNAGSRLVKFEKALDEVAKGDLDEVVYEGVRRHRGTDAAHVYGALYATLLKWCEIGGVSCDARTVQQIKIFSTGKGNASKESVVKAVEGWGFQPKNDNEADAIALLRLRLSETQPRDPVVPLPKSRSKLALAAAERALG